MTQDDTPKLHIDSDWKAEAQAEKERLMAQEAAQAEKGNDGRAGNPHALPEANFKTLVGVLASQALMGLGTMQDPQTKGVVVDLEGAQFSIDLLTVLEEKTRGNLEKEEGEELAQLLVELRNRFVQVTNLVAHQMASGAGGPGAPGGMGGAGLAGDGGLVT